MLNELELTGRARTHLIQRDDLGAAMHRDVCTSFGALKTAAAQDGIQLEIVSGYRDFETQLSIWNAKHSGTRPLYDQAGNIRDRTGLDEVQLIEAILSWSALPGASRHHWGTDLDVIDRAAMPENYRFRLLPQEFAPGGVFEPLGVWLDENIARFGFFRPYREYRGGVYPEPWHLSFGAIAAAALRLLTEELVVATLRDADMQGKDQVLTQIAQVYRRCVTNVCPAPAASAAGPQ